MAHKLMTTATNYGNGSSLDPSTSRASDDSLDGLRHQASDIIDSILSETEPEGSDVRDRLRRCLSRNRDNPERALLQHLMSLRNRSQSPVNA